MFYILLIQLINKSSLRLSFPPKAPSLSTAPVSLSLSPIGNAKKSLLKSRPPPPALPSPSCWQRNRCRKGSDFAAGSLPEQQRNRCFFGSDFAAGSQQQNRCLEQLRCWETSSEIAAFPAAISLLEKPAAKLTRQE